MYWASNVYEVQWVGHGDAKQAWSLSSVRSCPANNLSLGTVLRQKVSFFKAEDGYLSCDTSYISHYFVLSPSSPDAWKHLQKSGKPSSDVNCNFILNYISEFVPVPPTTTPTPGKWPKQASLWPVCGPLWAWPLAFWCPDLEPDSGGAYRPAPLRFNMPWLMETHGHVLFHWHWKLGPNYSGVNCIALSLVVGASVVCWLLWRVLEGSI